MSRYYESSFWSFDTKVIANDMLSMDEKRIKAEYHLRDSEVKIRETINLALNFADFGSKYNVRESPVYAHTKWPTKSIFVMEIYPVVQQPISSKKLIEDLTYHPMFEEVITRYTMDSRKPNQALQESRSPDFCYLLTVKFEIIPDNVAKYPQSHQLLREFQVLQNIWESYRAELMARKCGTDQLVGFPMPFEFKNIVGCPTYDFPKMSIEQYTFYNLNGKTEKICRKPASLVGFGTDTKTVQSCMSYLSMEKVGPNLVYLMDLMQFQSRKFSISSALKIYDQLLSRLMIFHKYGMVHGDINPRCLNFGCKEAANVLYISSFEMAVICNSHNEPLPFFHDRFVSHMQTKDRKCHYLCDLEAAFYVFIYMLLDRFPWDNKLQSTQKSMGSDDTVVIQDAVSQKSTTTELKEKFWSSSESAHWITKHVTYEFQPGLYCNFSIDLIDTLFAKMKESLSVCSVMTQANFFKELFISGSAPYNCYFGMRKVMASYFRFENLNQTLRDVTCASKLNMLRKEDPKDKRIAWDLSYWCWNCLDTDPDKKNCDRKPSQTIHSRLSNLQPALFA